ncbi:MAG: ATP-dependent helicase C-terminal domain-containing protein, partial [Victivallaceae bacterium]
LLEERDIGSFRIGTDIRDRLQMLRNKANSCRQVLIIRDQLLRLNNVSYQPQDIENAGLLTAFAYPDRIGKQRKTGSLNYLLSGGRGARFPEVEPVAASEFIVAARLDGAGTDAKIQLAAPVNEDDLRKHFSAMITAVDSMRFEHSSRATAIVRETRLGAIVLNSAPINNPPPELVTAALLEGIRETGLHVLPWNEEVLSLRERVSFARRLEPEIWPDWSDTTLLNSLDGWLAPFLSGIRSFDGLKKLNLQTVLSASLNRDLTNRLEREFPERFTAPTGSKIRIDYSTETPELPVRVQEMFGCAVHPVIGGGRVKLRIRLLSPAMRPIQITSDLPAFWHGSWELVKKEMKGRYPKHLWPDNPADTAPTRRAKPRS